MRGEGGVSLSTPLPFRDETISTFCEDQGMRGWGTRVRGEGEGRD